jgi:hypothetical protein
MKFFKTEFRKEIRTQLCKNNSNNNNYNNLLNKMKKWIKGLNYVNII